MRSLRTLALALALLGAGTAQATVDDVFNHIRLDDVAALTRDLGQGYAVDSVDANGNSLLMAAAREGAVGVTRLLLARGARPDYRNKAGDSAMLFAALHGHLAIVQQLVGARASIAGPGWTPLHYAAHGGHLAVCRYLIERGADIDARAPNGTTPLMMAARQGQTEVVRLLLWEVAEVGSRNEAGATALALARRGNFPDVIDLLRKAGARD